VSVLQQLQRIAKSANRRVSVLRQLRLAKKLDPNISLGIRKVLNAVAKELGWTHEEQKILSQEVGSRQVNVMRAHPNEKRNLSSDLTAGVAGYAHQWGKKDSRQAIGQLVKKYLKANKL